MDTTPMFDENLETKLWILTTVSLSAIFDQDEKVADFFDQLFPLLQSRYSHCFVQYEDIESVCGEDKKMVCTCKFRLSHQFLYLDYENNKAIKNLTWKLTFPPITALEYEEMHCSDYLAKAKVGVLGIDDLQNTLEIINEKLALIL